MSTIHKIVAQAFRERLPMRDVGRILEADPGRTDPKDVVFAKRGRGGIFAFNFGAVAFWNIDQEEADQLLKTLSDSLDQATLSPTDTEDFYVEENPSNRPLVGFNRLIIDRLNPERIEVVATTVAQSAAMEHHERLLEEIWEDVSRLVERMQVRGKVGMRPQILQKSVGQVVSVRNSVVGVLHLLDRPDLIWEDRTMDTLYEDPRAVFDLPERFQALKFKLESIQDTLELLLDASRDSRAFMVEVGILVVIIFEVIIYITDLMGS